MTRVKTQTLADKHICASHFAVDAIVTKGRIAPPMFMMWRGDSEVGLTYAPWDSHEEKKRIIGEMRATLDRERIDAYSFITEAWMARVNPRTQPELMNVPPSQRSQREDVLLVITQHRNGDRHSSVWRVEDQPDGTRVLHPPEHDGYSSMGGMGNLYAMGQEPVSGAVH
jgi:hypothetical protein